MAYNGTGDTGIDFSPYVTSASIVKLINGKWESCQEVTDGDQVRVQINYSLPAGKVNAENKKIYYQLPTGVFPNKEESGTVYHAGTDVGTYIIGTNGMIEITFNNTFATGESFRGTVYFEGSVAATGSGDENVIQFAGTGQTITVVKNTEVNDISISKSGSVSMSDHESATVEYTVTASTRQGTDGAVKITDAFKASGSTGTYIRDSFEVYKVDFTGQEAKLSNEEYRLGFGESDGQETFTVEGLPALYANEKYIVKYRASVTGTGEDGSGSVTNSAGANYKDTWAWSWNTVEISKTLIKKEGWYDENEDVITWRITVNESRKDISGYTVRDDLPEGLKIQGNVVITDSSGAVLETITDAADSGSFSYTFGEGSADVYTISFQTDAPADNGTVTNTAELRKEGEGSYRGETGVYVSHRDWKVEKWFSSEEVRDAHRQYNWNTEITLPGYALDESGFTYTDEILIPQGGAADSHYGLAARLQDAIESTLKIITGDGTALTYKDAERMLTILYYDGEGNPVDSQDETSHVAKFAVQVKPENGDFTGRRMTFTYPTVVDYTGMEEGDTWKFVNSADIPDHHAEASKEYTRPRTFSKQGGIKGNWGVSYSDGTAAVDMDDTEGILYYRLLLRTKPEENGDIIVTDLLQEGMKYVQGSMEGHFYINEYTQYKNEGSYNFDEDKVLVEETADENGGSQLKITVKGGYNDTVAAAAEEGRIIQLTYQVSVKEDPAWEDMKLEEKSYINRASWNGRTETHTTEVNRVVEKISKTGIQLDTNGNPLQGTENVSDRVEYTVVINPAGADLNPYGDTLTLVDILTVGGNVEASLLLDQLRLYQYDGDAPDHLGAVIERSQYHVSFDQVKHQMTLVLPDKRACVLIYQYRFTGTDRDPKISNSILLEGRYGSKSDTEIRTSSSGASVERAKVEIYKADNEDYGILLSGAEFTLEKRVHKEEEKSVWETVGTLSTGESGKIVLHEVTEGSAEENQVLNTDVLYRLTETKAPGGYSVSPEPYYFLCRAADELGNVPGKEELWQKWGQDFFTYDGEALDPGEIHFFGPSGGNLYVPNEYTGVGVRKVWLDQKGSAVEGNDSVGVQLYSYTQKTDPANETVVYATLQQTSGADKSSQEYHIARDSSVTFALGKLNWSAKLLQRDFYVETEGCTAALSIAGGSDWGRVLCTVDGITGSSCSVDIRVSYVDGKLPEDYEEGTAPGLIVTEPLPVGEPVTLNAANNWSYIWKNLETANAQGEALYYVVRELDTDPSYVVSYSEDSGIQKGEIVITNTLIAKEGELTIRKEWEDGEIPTAHDEIRVKLYKKAAEKETEDQLVDTVILDDFNDWIFHKTGLEADAEYYVEEEPTAGYTVTYLYDNQEYKTASDVPATVGNVVTISNTRQLTDVTAKKLWMDSEGADASQLTEEQLAAWGFSYKEITLHLYGTTVNVETSEDPQRYFEDGTVNGVLKEEYREYDGGKIRISAASGTDGWTGTWTGLPAVDVESGLPYFYYVVEEGDFKTVYENNGTRGVWQTEDETDQDGGESEESRAAEEQSAVQVRNILDTTWVTVTKKWFDENGEEITEESASHPDMVRVWLYRSVRSDKKQMELTEEERVKEPVKLGPAHAGEPGYDETGWRYTWTDLEWKNESGEMYYYYVKEEETEGYKTAITSYSAAADDASAGENTEADGDPAEAEGRGEAGEATGIVEGRIQIANTKIKNTEISLEKKWLDGDGNETEAPVSEIQAKLWRAVIQGSYEDVFTEARVDIQKGGQEFWKETIPVRKGTTLQMTVGNAAWINIDFNGETVSQAGTYSTVINGPVQITGNVTAGEDFRLERELIFEEEPAKEDPDFERICTLSGENGWKLSVSDLPREGVKDGETVSYVYGVKEVSSVKDYTVSYDKPEGIPQGQLTITNKALKTTDLTVKKEWKGKDGQAVTPEVNSIQVQPWRGQLPGGYEENFKTVTITIDTPNVTDSQQWTETLAVRTGSILTLTLKNVTWTAGITVNGELRTGTQNNSDYQYEIEVNEDLTITGAVNGNSCVVSQEVTGPEASFSREDYGEPLTLTADGGWQQTLTGLPSEAFTETGEKVTYVYGIREVAVPDGYAASYSCEDGTAGGTLTVTNTAAETEKIPVILKKKWTDKEGNPASKESGSITAEIWRTVDDGGSGSGGKKLNVDIGVGWSGAKLLQKEYTVTGEEVRIRFRYAYADWVDPAETLKNSISVEGAVWVVERDGPDAVCILTNLQDRITVTGGINEAESNWSFVSIEGVEEPDAGGSAADFLTGTDTIPEGAELAATVEIHAKNAGSEDWQTGIELVSSVTDALGNTTRYKYYIKEATQGPWAATYGSVTGDGSSENPYGLEFTNQETGESYVLPETGGAGTTPYTLGGAALTAIAVFLMYIQNKRRKEEQDSS